jgi:hypothetical protein
LCGSCGIRFSSANGYGNCNYRKGKNLRKNREKNFENRSDQPLWHLSAVAVRLSTTRTYTTGPIVGRIAGITDDNRSSGCIQPAARTGIRLEREAHAHVPQFRQTPEAADLHAGREPRTTLPKEGITVKDVASLSAVKNLAA